MASGTGQREHDARKREHGPDRQVDASRQDHKGEADRDHGIDHGLLRHVEEVAGGKEVRCEHAQHEAEHDKNTDRPGLAGVGDKEAGKFHAAWGAASAQ
jgi:hypothetical protein